MGAATSLAYLRLHGFDRFRAYLHIDQAPRVLNDHSYKDGLFGDDQSDILASWSGIGDRLEACGRETPFRRLPPDLRRAFTGVLARFFSYAFHRRLARAFSGAVRYERFARGFVEPDNWPLYLDAMRAYRTEDYDFRPSLGRIAIPMQIFVGTESRMYPPAGQIAMREHVPHAKVISFARAGHAVPIEAPIRFSRALGDFLDASVA